MIAGRLAAADSKLSILMIEGGRNNLNEPTIVTPAIYLANLEPAAGNALFYKANADKNVNGREVVVPTGGILGGGSSINFMMYTRAAGSDFDSWKTEGWDQECLLRVAKKVGNLLFEKYTADILWQCSWRIIIYMTKASISPGMVIMALLTFHTAHTGQNVQCKTS